MVKGRSFSDKFKAVLALEAFRGEKTAQEIAAKHKVHPTQVTAWKLQAIDGLTAVFSDKVRRADDKEVEVKNVMPGSGSWRSKKNFRKDQSDWPSRTQDEDQSESNRSGANQAVQIS